MFTLIVCIHNYDMWNYSEGLKSLRICKIVIYSLGIISVKYRKPVSNYWSLSPKTNKCENYQF